MGRGVLLLLARVLLAAMFLASGWTALSNVAGTAGYFRGLALPAPALMAWGVGCFELLAGVMLIVGFQTRMVAAALAAFSVAASMLGHYGQDGDAALAFMHAQMLLKDFAVAGGLIVLSLHGAGAISVDGARS